MISYFKFLLLSLHEKKQYLTEKAIFLLSYPTHPKEIRLYAVSNFFVEMHLDEQKQVTEIISFNESGHLEQYTRHISLAQLHALGLNGSH